ncbi:MAG: MCP four helix bundle domain-containing protein [Winogradskyella sp.]|uniref:MCP four helix bundle domain-containing protein n=1 Tax=Winogradskyella sp. TaxID=1883156 RepID=UPI00385E67C4
MGNKLSLNNRVKIGFSFAIVFLLVLATNRIDKKRFTTISESLTSVYEDRLVAKGHLYKLNNIFHDQEKGLLADTLSYKAESYHNEVDDLIISFKSTKLTRGEKTSLDNFENHFNELKIFENSMMQLNSKEMRAKLQMQLKRIQKDLDDLALIQLQEGESMTNFANSSLKTSATMSKIEIGVIILIGIIVQFIIFYK